MITISKHKQRIWVKVLRVHKHWYSDAVVGPSENIINHYSNIDKTNYQGKIYHKPFPEPLPFHFEGEEPKSYLQKIKELWKNKE